MFSQGSPHNIDSVSMHRMIHVQPRQSPYKHTPHPCAAWYESKQSGNIATQKTRYSKQIILKIHPLANRQHDRRLGPYPIHRRLRMRLIVQLDLIALRIPLPPSPIHLHIMLRPRPTLTAGLIGFMQAVEGGVTVLVFAEGVAAVTGSGRVSGGIRAVSAAPDNADEERA